MADADVGMEFDRTDAPDGFEGGCETQEKVCGFIFVSIGDEGNEIGGFIE